MGERGGGSGYGLWAGWGRRWGYCETRGIWILGGDGAEVAEPFDSFVGGGGGGDGGKRQGSCYGDGCDGGGRDGAASVGCVSDVDVRKSVVGRNDSFCYMAVCHTPGVYP